MFTSPAPPLHMLVLGIVWCFFLLGLFSPGTTQRNGSHKLNRHFFVSLFCRILISYNVELYSASADPMRPERVFLLQTMLVVSGMDAEAWRPIIS